MSRFVADFVGSSNVLPPEFVGAVRGREALGEPQARSHHAWPRASAAGPLTGTVTSRSYLGAGTRFAIDLNGTKVHAVVPASDDLPGEGDLVAIGFSKEALHFMESGE